MERIAESLIPLLKPIDELKFDPNNVRTHSKRNIDAVKASLDSFGQQKPIVMLPDGTIIAGNATLEAAKLLGWEDIAVSVFQGTAKEAMAFGISDNRTAELAEWDWAGLSEQLSTLNGEGWDLEEHGWGAEETDPLFSAEFDPDEFNEEPEMASSGVKAVTVTEEQREVFERALERLREINADYSISEGRALELICADYLSGS